MSWARAVTRVGGDSLDTFKTAIETCFRVPHSVLMSSGRAALALGLRALSIDSPRKVVVIPAYACYTVAASAVRAGLRIRLCDVDPETLDYDPQALEQALRDDVLAVVAAGLYGMPADVVAVRARAEVFGCHVVDDAAQSFGGEIDGRPCGGHGDFGVTSFSKGKGLSTFEGGAILSSNAGLLDKVATLLAEETERPYGAMAMIVRSAGYAAFQRPRLYGLVHRISMLELGRSVFDPTFGIGTFTEFQAALGLEALARSTNVVNARRNRAAGYQALLEDVPGLKMPRVHHRAKPAWTRFPLLLDDPDRRQALLAKLTEQGLGASASYPEALGSLHELQPYFSDSSSGCYPGAQRIARTIITLPTHSAVLAAEQERIRDILLWGMKSSTQKTMRL